MNEVGLVIGDRNPHMKYIPFDLAPLNRARAFADAVGVLLKGGKGKWDE